MLTAYRQLELVEFPRPEPGADEVLIRVRSCGICGSDVHGYDGASGRRIPPIIMGHEAAGEIEAVGPAVAGWKPGQRVTFDSTVYCGRCGYCRRGDIHLCNQRRVLGVSCGEYRQHGAMAEWVAVPERILYRLPDGLGFVEAALVEPVAIAFHAANRTPRQLGDTAVVVGAGMIGQLAIQALRLAGCGRVFAVDIEEGRLELAGQLGAEEGFNPQRIDAAAAVRERTEGEGADVALEAVGAAASLQTAIGALRKGGALTMVGNIAPRVELPLQQIVTRELTLLGSCASRGDYAASIAAIASGRIQVQPLISARAPLAEGPAWFDRLYRKEPGLLKVVLDPAHPGG